jgi:ectoine hydroxylase-related dioxygenase (phytanoyl-CoA dioxygenase family)
MPHQPTVVLTQDQIDFYHENGYLSLDSITTQEEIDRLVGVYDHLFATRAGREEGNQFDLASPDEEGKEAVLPQILGPRNYAPELADTLYEANARAIAEQLLGKSVHFAGDHAIFKPARSGAATPWHQDEAYWDPNYNYESMSFWMPLQEATLENGCMQFIPGSHKMEVIPHRSIGGDTRIHGLETVDPIDESKAVACPLPAGGATIHASRTLHYTGANHSNIPRRAYILGFGGNNTLRTDGRRFPWNEAKHTPREDRSAQAAKEKTEKAAS